MLNKYLSTIVFLAFFLSFTFNILGVSSDFNSFQNDSEALVIDGLTHYKMTGESNLGVYKHSNNNDIGFRSKDFYKHSINDFKTLTNNTHKFKKYTSQFGLQGKFFSGLVDIFSIKSVITLKAINSFLFSILLTIIFCWVKYNINKGSAIIFAISMILSPWIVDFSNNLYWVPFTWILPFVIVLTLGLKLLKNVYYTVVFSLFLITAFYIKFMSGFEYITTIGMLAVFPVIYFYLNKLLDFKKSIILFSIIVISFISAFSLSIYSYINKYGEQNLNAIIAKRINIGEIKTYKDCIRLHASNDLTECKEFVTSLNSNPLKVIARYFLFDGFLPYSKYESKYNVNEIKEKSTKWLAFKNNPTLSAYQDLDNKIKEDTSSRLILLGVNLTFIVLIFISSFFARNNKHEIILLGYSFLCPISWFILAKGHSYVHTHMNYVLWYMPFVPVMLIYLYNQWLKYKNSKSLVVIRNN